MITNDNAQYTIKLWTILYSLIGKEMSSTFKLEDYQKARKYVFDFEYPLEEEFKELFEISFLMYYYNRELGIVPFSNWKTRVMSYLFINSKKWNLLLESQKITFEYDKPFNLTETEKLKSTSEQEEKSTTGSTVNTVGSDSGKQTSISSDLPQAKLNQSQIGGGIYANKSSEDENTITTKNGSIAEGLNESQNKSENSYEKTLIRSGNNGLDYSRLLMNYRETIVNYIQLMLDEMEYLFFGIL